MEKTKEYESLIITHLHRIWDESIENGWITCDEMHDMLFDQITGGEDLSPDELDEPIARLLGWDINNMTDSYWNEWRNIVDMAAKEYITR